MTLCFFLPCFFQFLPQLYMFGLREIHRADDKSHNCNGNGINKPCIDISRTGYNISSNKRGKTPKPAIPEVVGYGHGSISNSGWEEFYQKRSDRTVNHGYIDNLNQYKQGQHDHIRMSCFHNSRSNYLAGCIYDGFFDNCGRAGKVMHGIVNRKVS